MTVLHTLRMRLEPFCDAHLDGLHRMNSDPAVMRYITGRAESRDETAAGIDRVQARWREWGYSWWAFIETATDEIIGAGCIQHLAGKRENPLEIGWRLRRDKWGCGYATEAARAMAGFAFETLGASEIVAIRDPANTASARVMERIGMQLRGIERWYDADLCVHVMTQAPSSD